MTNKFKFGFLISVVAVAVYACGGESKPAAAPESSTEPAMPAESSDGGMDDEHAMPDGSTMSGHEHDGGMDGMK
jgi:hypothetical protein